MTPSSTFDHALSGNAIEGFSQLFKSSYLLYQAAFMLLMTWVNTVAYFCQTDLIARTFTAIVGRAPRRAVRHRPSQPGNLLHRGGAE